MDAGKAVGHALDSVKRDVRSDIVSLRISHCRAEQAAQEGRFHLAVLHYRECLEAAERRQDCQAAEFFALRLADCYAQMDLPAKAAQFRALVRPGSDDAALLS